MTVAQLIDKLSAFRQDLDVGIKNDTSVEWTYVEDFLLDGNTVVLTDFAVDEIKPCPFCGERLLRTERDGEFAHWITHNCILDGFRISNQETWNRRVCDKTDIYYSDRMPKGVCSDE